ncbi:hypothetical protein LCGC14_1675380, partial [marine sediment metagenome]
MDDLQRPLCFLLTGGAVPRLGGCPSKGLETRQYIMTRVATASIRAVVAFLFGVFLVIYKCFHKEMDMPDNDADIRNIRIFDTTLRDGEQSPGATMTIEEKLRLARQLARLGVDIIEAGFAIASDGDFNAIKLIAAEVEGPVICSLARAKEGDIKRAHEAIKDAPRRRIHTF